MAEQEKDGIVFVKGNVPVNLRSWNGCLLKSLIAFLVKLDEQSNGTAMMSVETWIDDYGDDCVNDCYVTFTRPENEEERKARLKKVDEARFKKAKASLSKEKKAELKKIREHEMAEAKKRIKEQEELFLFNSLKKKYS